MAADVIHADDFGKYGTGATSVTNMALEGTYAAIGNTTTVESSNPPANRTRHVRTTSIIGDTTPSIRMLFGGDKLTIRAAVRAYCGQLPSSNGISAIFQFRDNANVGQLALAVTTTGALQIWRGGDFSVGVIGGTLLATSSTAPFTAGTYHHVEMVAVINDSTGSTEVRVDGVAVPGLSLSNVDTKQTSIAGVAQMVPCRCQSSGSHGWDWCDLSFGDTAVFLGDVSWFYLPVDADTAQTDWVRNTGSTDFSMLSELAQDGDTTYVSAANVSDSSDYGCANLPGTASTVVAVIATSLARKTDAGTANHQNKVKSGVSTGTGTSRPLTTNYAYYNDVFATDPATGVAWTPSSVNAALLNITKAA